MQLKYLDSENSLLAVELNRKTVKAIEYHAAIRKARNQY
jgi:hypothetical protein